MSLNQFTQEQLKEMSLIEMAYEMLNSQKQPASFQEILDEITATLGLTKEEVRARIAQFYTDLNIDGRFMSLGENRWGLRVWYPVDQTEEEVVTPTKPKKKKAKKVVDEDDDIDFEEEDELDYDEVLDEEEDPDDLVDDDEEFEEEDLEEDLDEDLLDEDDEEFEELEEDGDDFDTDEEED